MGNSPEVRMNFNLESKSTMKQPGRERIYLCCLVLKMFLKDNHSEALSNGLIGQVSISLVGVESLKLHMLWNSFDETSLHHYTGLITFKLCTAGCRVSSCSQAFQWRFSKF